MEEKLILRASFKNHKSSPRQHFHNAYQIIYIKAGKTKLNINGVYYQVNSGTLVFMSPLRNHFFEFEGEVTERYELLINNSIAEKCIQNSKLMAVFQARPDVESCMVKTGELCENVEEFIKDIVKEYETDGEFTNEVQTANIYKLLTYVFRNFPEIKAVVQSQPEKHINLIRKYIEEKFTESVSIEEIAEIFHINRYYLTHRFKLVTGYSPKQYMLLCRIAKARQLLTGSDISIMQIAGLCGFGDASNFSRHFRAETGYTPKKFRAKYKNVI